MDDKKLANHSHGEDDLRQRLATAFNEEETDSEDPPESDENAELLCQAIARLRAVRVPGKGRLSLQESIDVAISQGRAFKRWKGTAIGEIEVWVEGCRVMSVMPESPAQLQEVAFKVPSPDTSVLQLTTQSDDEKVVLYSLLLRDLPPEGLNHIEAWPNGQSIALAVTRKMRAATAAALGNAQLFNSERIDEFGIRIAINPQKSETESQTFATTPASPPAVSGTGRDRSASARKPKAMAAGAGSSFVTKCAVGLLILGSLMVGSMATLERSASKKPGAALQSSELALREPVITAEVSPNPADLSTTSQSTGEQQSGQKTVSLSTPATQLRKPKRIPNGTLNTSLAETAHHVESSNAGDVALLLERPSSESLKVSVFPKLAALKKVYVLTDTRAVEPARFENLRVSFVRALEASERFKVLNADDHLQADGVISLRFESSDPCLGVVFLNISGPDGKFLWQDFAWGSPQNCSVTSPSTGDGTIFTDASATLVKRLRETVRLAQESTKGTEGFSAGE